MRQLRWNIVVALLLSACGGAQQAEQPAAPSIAPAATTTTGEAPTEALFRAEPTAPPTLPTATPAAAAEPSATSAPSTIDSQPGTAMPATKPTAEPAPQAEVGQPSEPVRVVIDVVGIDFKVVSVGLDTNRVPIVPDHDVGWYNNSAQPGQGDNVVLWGHVLRFRKAPHIPAPFARIKEVKPGAKVVLYDQQGKMHNYVVKDQIWVKPDEVEYILPKGKEMVTMVSCIGDKVIADGAVVDESHRLLTIAVPEA